MRFSQNVDELVFNWNEFQNDTFQTIRNLILDANPAIIEEVKYNVPFYTLNGLLMYVSQLKNGGLYLSFCQGNQMTDFGGLFFLEDETKHVRKVYFNQNQEIDWPTVESYILEAVAINMKERSFLKSKKPR